ncbi:MAG TPA: glycosyltransferase [Polyangia bacterium]|nr:glycosyltransferase [Polyangia bacterium]
MPQVSVVIPIYNVEAYLPEAMSSLLGQTLGDIEVLAVNDGSSDSSGEIVDRYAAMDRRVRPIHQANAGYGAAVNAGLRLARGTYVGILEADDFVVPDAYRLLYELAERSECDIARGSYRFVEKKLMGRTEVTLGVGRGPFQLADYPEFIATPPAIWSAIYRTAFLRDHDIHVIASPGASYQDVDFFVRTAVLARKIVCVDDAVYCYRCDNPSSSTNNRDKLRAIFRNYEETDRFISETSRASPRIVAHYQRRKICDLLWHFKRLDRRYWMEYSLEVSRCLRKVPDGVVLPVLSGVLLHFFLGVKYLPRLACAYKLAKSGL